VGPRRSGLVSSRPRPRRHGRRPRRLTQGCQGHAPAGCRISTVRAALVQEHANRCSGCSTSAHEQLWSAWLWTGRAPWHRPPRASAGAASLGPDSGVNQSLHGAVPGISYFVGPTLHGESKFRRTGGQAFPISAPGARSGCFRPVPSAARRGGPQPLPARFPGPRPPSAPRRSRQRCLSYVVWLGRSRTRGARR
jgi:hypothetical protein